MINLLLPFVISLLIGLLLGIERERSHPEGSQAIGVRTFVLLCLLGTIANKVNNNTLTLTLSLFVFSIIIISYFQTTHKASKKTDIGITTEIAAGMVFILGYMVPHYPLTTITISAVVLLVLMERKRIHFFSREKIREDEIESLIILIILGVGIIPILPDRTIDPWGLFNPRNFGILIAVIAAMQYSGYLAVRLFGQNLGRAVLGFFGGLVSSTAVFAALKTQLRSDKFQLATMTSAILATTAMICEFSVIILVASPILFISLVWPIITMLFSCFVIVYILLYRQNTNKNYSIKTKYPLKLTSLLLSALVIAAILIIVALVKQNIGTSGILWISFAGALVEAHGVALATALLYLNDNINLSEANSVLAVTMLAGFISKFILLWALTPIKFAFQCSILLLIILSSGGAMYLLTW